MIMSASGFCYPSDVVDAIAMSFYGDVVLETGGSLDDVFANEWVVECGLESGD